MGNQRQAELVAETERLENLAKAAAFLRTSPRRVLQRAYRTPPYSEIPELVHVVREVLVNAVAESELV